MCLRLAHACCLIVRQVIHDAPLRSLQSRVLRGKEPKTQYGTEGAIQGRVRPLVLLSVLIATFMVPAVLARRPASFRHVLVLFAASVAVYVFLLLVVYPRVS
jgi:hypothetical protein